MPYQNAISIIGIGRVLFISESGHIGMIPSDARPGDQIHLFLGSQFPLVLHPHGKAFELVGDCYLDGLMEGQAHGDLSSFAEIEII